MDTPTRIGIIGAAGALALTFATLIWPQMPSWITYPGFLLSLAVAIWGLWPFLYVPRWRFRLSLQEAAQRAYEAAEREGWLERAVTLASDPQNRLNSFKFMFLVDKHTNFRGVRPPSTQPHDILRSEIAEVADGKLQRLKVHPILGESRLNWVWPHDKVAFENVTLAKRDLWRLLRQWRKRIEDSPE